jgi:hypothetical protein
LDPLAGTVHVRKLKCAHHFHVACVDEMLRFGVTQCCALCRAAIRPNPSDHTAAATAAVGDVSGDGGRRDGRYAAACEKFVQLKNQGRLGVGAEWAALVAALTALSLDEEAADASADASASTERRFQARAALGAAHGAAGNLAAAQLALLPAAAAGHCLAQANLAAALVRHAVGEQQLGSAEVR